ncbi:MAG: hypothetical protein ACTSUE_01675 [Promethearchaeota archaeon]
MLCSPGSGGGVVTSPAQSTRRWLHRLAFQWRRMCGFGTENPPDVEGVLEKKGKMSDQ